MKKGYNKEENVTETISSPKSLAYLLSGPSQKRFADPWSMASSALVDLWGWGWPFGKQDSGLSVSPLFLTPSELQKAGLMGQVRYEVTLVFDYHIPIPIPNIPRGRRRARDEGSLSHQHLRGKGVLTSMRLVQLLSNSYHPALQRTPQTLLGNLFFPTNQNISPQTNTTISPA